MSLQTDQSLVCPKCGASIKLTESLAAPLIAATRSQYEQQLQTQAKGFAAEKQTLKAQQEENERRAAELEATAKKQKQEIAKAVQEGVGRQLSEDRKSIAQEESVRARQQVEDEIKDHERALQSQTTRIEALTQKLSVAQQAQAEFLKQKREFEDKERELTLNLQKGIADGLEQARAQALGESQTRFDLKVQDLQRANLRLREEITELQKKADQGSQQAQGESLEILLENQLRTQFPFDLIEPVGKGEFGGDILQHVRDNTGQVCGKILWESKRTKSWSENWLTKLKKDQRDAHADLAVIVSQALPKNVTHFSQVEGIWVSSLGCILPVASALRISLIDLAVVRCASKGQETKAQQIYAYLTGPGFKHRVECIVEKFTELRKDLDSERKWMTKQWAKRDRELIMVLEATSGMCGDLQGIAGQTVFEIDALEQHMLLEPGLG